MQIDKSQYIFPFGGKIWSKSHENYLMIWTQKSFCMTAQIERCVWPDDAMVESTLSSLIKWGGVHTAI